VKQSLHDNQGEGNTFFSMFTQTRFGFLRESRKSSSLIPAIRLRQNSESLRNLTTRFQILPKVWLSLSHKTSNAMHRCCKQWVWHHCPHRLLTSLSFRAADRHGKHSGLAPLKTHKFSCTQNTYFKHKIETKIFSPKTYLTPPTLKPGCKSAEFSETNTMSRQTTERHASFSNPGKMLEI